MEGTGCPHDQHNDLSQPSTPGPCRVSECSLRRTEKSTASMRNKGKWATLLQHAYLLVCGPGAACSKLPGDVFHIFGRWLGGYSYPWSGLHVALGLHDIPVLPLRIYDAEDAC